MKFGIQAGIFGDLEQGLRKIKEAGYDGVEWDWDSVKESSGEILSSAKKIKELSAANGLEPISVTPGILPNHAEEQKRVEIQFEAIRETGTRFVRMFGPVYIGILDPKDKFQAYYDGRKDYHTLANDFRRHLEVLVKLARKYELCVLFETHDGYFPTSFSGCYLFFKDFPKEYVGVVLDPENMIREGVENWRMGIEMIRDYIAYVHVKNICWSKEEGVFMPPQYMKNWKRICVGLDEGLVDWEQIIFLLKKHGFSGYLVDEDFSRSNPEERIQNITYLKKLLNNEKDPWEKWFNWGRR